MARPVGLAVTHRGTASRVDQCSQVIKSVGGDKASGDEFPQSRLNVGFRFAASAHNVNEETCSMRLQIFHDFARSRTQSLDLIAGIFMGRMHARSEERRV